MEIFNTQREKDKKRIAEIDKKIKELQEEKRLLRSNLIENLYLQMLWEMTHN